MKLKIGFRGYEKEENTNMQVTEPVVAAPVKSVVQVRFPSDGRSFAYYNDRYDLKVGDIVFVEGKLEGLQGIVTEVSHSFKIKLSDYKRVITKADTHVSGALYFGGSHLIAFDDTVIPYDKIRGWFFAPEDDGEVAVGYGDESFLLENLGKFKIRPEIADRGFDYYNCNKVIYISLCGEKGIAIVNGSKPYEVSFTYRNGEISDIICGCWCSYHCKHEFAVLLQLRETLETIEKQYNEEFEESDYFAAVSKSILFSYAVSDNEKGRIVLE